MINLIGISERKLKDLFQNWGEEPYRVHQVFNWIYHHEVKRFDLMTNMSKSLRNRLSDHFYIELPRILERTASHDGSIKFLFELKNGERVESVWMPDGARKTLCLSTQVGCRLACDFCLTGTLGLKNNLSAGDIIGQYMAVKEDLGQDNAVTNIVFMGMGEPFDNYEAVCDALRLMISPEAMRISTRKITVSTSGLVEKIDRFKTENLPVNLAISLNATDDATRTRLMPINKKYPIATLLECLRDYPLKPSRRITFEYVLLKGVNDSMQDAARLARLLRGIPCKINLIPFNGFTGSPYRAPADLQVARFQNHLIAQNYSVFIRKNRGTDILGACGQLAAGSFEGAAVEKLVF